MRQYSTPQFRFRLKGNDLETLLAGKCYLSFGKWDTLTESYQRLFDADYDVEEENGDIFIVTSLTQEQTAQYSPNTNAYVQFRIINGINSVVTSMASIRVLPTIKNEILNDSDTLKNYGDLTFNKDGSVTGSHLTSIPDYDTITSIDLPVCTSVGNYAFDGCSSLTTIDLPVCMSVGQYAFNSCSSLTTIDLPACTSVGDNVFYNCSSLTSIYLPVCTSVGGSAFQNCSALTTIDLPVCTSVDDDAFYYCSSLTTIDLPVCTSVGTYAFYGCSSLTTVILRNTSGVVTLSNSNAFSRTSSSLSIYVPDSLVSSYKTATNWSTYADKIKPLSELPS